MALATLENGAQTIARHGQNELVVVPPRVPHNVYLPSGAKIHTVKVGSKRPDDWISEPELDAMVLGICEAELLKS